MSINTLPSYTAVIRTLGKAGYKYHILLDTLCSQSFPPKKILVYIPEGYKLPKESCGREKYIRCKKGMVAQRALPFNEVDTDWMLFCDDDISFESKSVEKLFLELEKFNEVKKNWGQSVCISPDTFPNHRAPIKDKLKNILLLTFPHWNNKWAFKIRESLNYSYNNCPSEVLPTQSAAFPCCLINKEAYKKIHFDDEQYLDDFGYSLGDDTLFYYKLFRMNFHPIVSFNSDIKHLDAGTGHSENCSERIKMSTASLFTVWHRARYSTHKSVFGKIWCGTCYWITFIYKILLFFFSGLLKHNFTTLISYIKGIHFGLNYIKSEKYKNLTPFLAYLEETK